jgi:hypothetical protein
MPYFKDFPRMIYGAFGTDEMVVDITIRTKIVDTIDSSVYAYETYDIIDGDRPDIISSKYYGRSDLHWLIFMANDMISLDDWPKTDQEIYNGLIAIYGSDYAIDDTSNPDAIVYYEDINGLIVSYDADGQKFPITILANEKRENDAKRRIRLVKREYINQILALQSELLKE